MADKYGSSHEAATAAATSSSAAQSSKWDYDAETEKRRSKQRLETFGRDVQAVTTTSTVYNVQAYTFLWVCIHVVTMCASTATVIPTKSILEVSGSACAIWYQL